MKKLLSLFTALPLVAILMFSTFTFAGTGDIVIEGKYVEVPSNGMFYSASYFPDYNEADQGATGNGKSVKAYIDTISTDSATLVFRHNSGTATTTYTFFTDETIPDNINVVIEKGAILSMDNTKTLTINNFDDPGPNQVVSGDGNVVFGYGSIDAVRPEWWVTNTTPGTTDMHVAFEKAFACMIASDLPTCLLTNSHYYFADYVEMSTADKNIRIIGQSSAGFWVSGMGTKISGADGLTTLFLFSSNRYGLEVKNIYFEGTHATTGTVSALKNTGSGSPSRPFIVENCHFLYFAKAIWSTITGATGICQVIIHKNTFLTCTNALYSEDDGVGYNAIMDLSFKDNVSENGGSIHLLSAGGTINISDNILEGNKDAIYVDTTNGLLNTSIKRNYFETNSDNLIYYHPSSLHGTLVVSDNYYLGCGGLYVDIYGSRVNIKDDLEQKGILLSHNSLRRGSIIPTNIVYLSDAEMGSSFFDPIILKNQGSVQSLTNGIYVRESTSAMVDTPLNLRGIVNVTGTSAYSIASLGNMVPDDYVSVTLLIKTVDLVSGNTIAINLYTDASVPAGNETLYIGGDTRNREWYLIHAMIKVTAATTGVIKAKVAATPGKSFVISDAYYHKVAAAGRTDPFYIYMPTLAASGEAIMAIDATSVVVTHGLEVKPANIILAVKSGDIGSVWTSAVGAATFTINCSSNSHGAVEVQWRSN